MKKGFKKFFGVMAVSSILCGGAGVGASAVGVSAVTGALRMNDEDVKAMNAAADFFLLGEEMIMADRSKWGDYADDFKELIDIMKESNLESLWCPENCSKDKKWKQAADIQKTLDETVKSMGLREELQKWAEENNLCCCM